MAHKFTAAIWRKRTLLIAFSIVIVVALGPYLVSRARSQGRRVTIHHGVDVVVGDDFGEIRVVTFNVAHGRGATDDNWEEDGSEKHSRISKIAQLIRQMDVDVVVLNEVDFCATWSGHQNQAEAIAELAGFPHRVEQRNLDFQFVYGSWKFGNAVLSKFPIVDAKVIDLPRFRSWEAWLAGFKRGVLCTLQLTPEKQIGVLAVHLEHRSEQVRVESARMIAEVANAANVPLIAAGDFNSTPAGFPHAITTDDGKNAMEVIKESGVFQLLPDASPGQPDMTYSTTQPTQVIDWILIPKASSFSDYRVVDTKLSDHRPVIATIRLD
jgi:endonuclease/exonuclease/phosphatase family metal-dependent hydrolase